MIYEFNVIVLIFLQVICTAAECCHASTAIFIACNFLVTTFDCSCGILSCTCTLYLRISITVLKVYKLQLMYMHRCFLSPSAGMPRFASPYNTVVRTPFPPRPLGAAGVIPPLSRPPVLIRAPIAPPIIRPAPSVAPVEKPQTIVYVGKIASRVDNDFMLSLLQLCGPVKSWKRYQDPSTGTLKSFGFCEFESAEGVLRALRLLSKLNIDGQELLLKVDEATREHLKRYVKKKVESSKSSKETEGKEAEKEESSEVVADGNESKTSEETKLDSCETQENHESASFGLVTDEDRTTDHEVLEKITGMLEERMKNMPLPPPPPLTPANASANSEPQREGESDVDDKRKVDGKDETSDHKPTSEHERAEQSSPDRGRKDERRSKDRERDLKREKERELERIEREREQERAKREKERDYKIREDERRYKLREKDWEGREKEKEHYRKREREREKERAQERKWEIVDQEREIDDGYSKRRKHRSSDEDRRRRQREKEDDLADKLREEEEIAEAKRIAEEEAQRTLQLEALKALSQHTDNGVAKPVAPDEKYMTSEVKPFDQTSDQDEDMADEGILHNGATEELEGNNNSNAPVRKLGFGLSGSGKRTAVPSVFYEDEEEDKRKDKKMRPLVPLDYSTEEQQAVEPPTSVPPFSNLAAAAEFAKHISNVNSKEERHDVDRERSRRHHDRSSQRDRDRHDGESKHVRDENAKESSGRDKVRDHGTEKVKTAESKIFSDAKELIDMIPKTKEELFSYKINWDIYEEHNLHERMKPWISKKITEFLGEEEPTLVDYIVSTTHEHVKATTMLENLQSILDEEAEMFVLKMWRMLIFEIKKVETGLAFKSKH
ncbi:hypothetical protein Leryth_016208 [Lithospermum erythrorhizon]|nr:hypothetical protein Leryth_016208 [Lithospermum erythrorhizon]